MKPAYFSYATGGKEVIASTGPITAAKANKKSIPKGKVKSATILWRQEYGPTLSLTRLPFAYRQGHKKRPLAGPAPVGPGVP